MGRVFGLLIRPPPLCPLLDIPEKRKRRIKPSGQIAATGQAGAVLPGRDIGNELESTLLDLLGDSAAAGLIGRLKPIAAQLLKLRIGGPAGRRTVDAATRRNRLVAGLTMS